MWRDRDTLIDMVQFCRRAQEYVAGLDEAAFSRDPKTQSSVLHQLMLLGEAGKCLSPAAKERIEDVPWRKLVGMRDKLIHAYDDVDIELIWSTITQAVPKVEKSLRYALIVLFQDWME